VDFAAVKRRLREVIRVLGRWYSRLPAWIIVACSVVVFFGGIAMLQYGMFGVLFCLMGAVFFMVNIVSVASRSGPKDVDPELRFAWSVNKSGPVITWRLKAVKNPKRFKRNGRFTVGLFGTMTVLVCVGYGVIGWSSTRGGLRSSDLPTFVPVAFLALALLAVIVRIAWKAVHDLVPYEVTLDPIGREIHCTGLQPTRGIITATLPLQSIARLKSSQTTYKSVTIVRVFAYGNDGERHVLFGGLNTDDWHRISTQLAPIFRECGITGS
jgi:hypothetical protein